MKHPKKELEHQQRLHREGDAVDCLHVLFEHHEQGKALAALCTLERHVLPVLDPGVFAQGRRSVEAFPADVAAVRFFPGVSPHVFFHVTFQFVSPATNWTAERFLPGVCPHVTDHFAPGVNFPAADEAGELLVGRFW